MARGRRLLHLVCCFVDNSTVKRSALDALTNYRLLQKDRVNYRKCLTGFQTVVIVTSLTGLIYRSKSVVL